MLSYYVRWEWNFKKIFNFIFKIRMMQFYIFTKKEISQKYKILYLLFFIYVYKWFIQ